jgi:hypothetical protein
LKKEKTSNNIFLIIAIIIVIVIFIVSLGQINITQNNIIQEKEKDLSKLKHQHQKLKGIIEKKEGLNKKLNRKFKWIYFGVRFGLFLLYSCYNLALYLTNFITDLDDFLNFNELALIVISIFSFLTFGTFANLAKFIQDIKMKLEIRIYRKYENLNKEIEIHKIEINSLSTSIQSKQTELIEHQNTIKAETKTL